MHSPRLSGNSKILMRKGLLNIILNTGEIKLYLQEF